MLASNSTTESSLDKLKQVNINFKCWSSLTLQLKAMHTEDSDQFETLGQSLLKRLSHSHTPINRDATCSSPDTTDAIPGYLVKKKFVTKIDLSCESLLRVENGDSSFLAELRDLFTLTMKLTNAERDRSLGEECIANCRKALRDVYNDNASSLMTLLVEFLHKQSIRVLAENEVFVYKRFVANPDFLAVRLPTDAQISPVYSIIDVFTTPLTLKNVLCAASESLVAGLRLKMPYPMKILLLTVLPRQNEATWHEIQTAEAIACARTMLGFGRHLPVPSAVTTPYSRAQPTQTTFQTHEDVIPRFRQLVMELRAGGEKAYIRGLATPKQLRSPFVMHQIIAKSQQIAYSLCGLSKGSYKELYSELRITNITFEQWRHMWETDRSNHTLSVDVYSHTSQSFWK
jgi:hypothetical protein